MVAELPRLRTFSFDADLNGLPWANGRRMEVPDDEMFDYLELMEIKAFADTEELVERWKAWEETYFFIVQNYMIAFMKKCSALNTIEWHLCGCSPRRRTAQPVWLWRRIKKKARRDVLVSSEDPSSVKEGTFVLGDLFIPRTPFESRRLFLSPFVGRAADLECRLF